MPVRLNVAVRFNGVEQPLARISVARVDISMLSQTSRDLRFLHQLIQIKRVE